MGKDVIIALDFPDGEQTCAFLDRLGDKRPYVKIGLELFYSEGPDIVRRLKDRGHKVFLDLKLHDIPNQVKRAAAVLSRLGADMTNVHAGGGMDMMKAALEGLTRPDGTRPLLIAVTQLTSTSPRMLREELLISEEMEKTVARYGMNAKLSGLDGVVCSPLEAAAVKENCGSDFLTVTPGVRFPESDKGDQSRVATPANASELGSDYIVMGRPITRAEDPEAAYVRAMRDFTGESYLI